MSTPMHSQIAQVLAFLLFGFFGGDVSAQEAQEGKDMKLEDMGFIMRPANTPAQIERLRLLPPRTFVTHSKDGKRYYLYADPEFCKCVFVGDALAMKNYLAFVSPPPQAPMPLGPDGGPVAGSLIQELDPGIPLVDGDIFDYPP
jgi:hypothetical protein